MKKFIFETYVKTVENFGDGLVHLCLVRTDGLAMPPMLPGQFVEVSPYNSPALLNRPISVFYANECTLGLLVKNLGPVSKIITGLHVGDRLKIIGPLGRGFTVNENHRHPLLVGGGVGVAPLLYLAQTYSSLGIIPAIVFGARTAPDERLLEMYSRIAELHVCTDDGSRGFHGFVSQHPELLQGNYDILHVCGPEPMMRAVAAVATDRKINCEVSLENRMACGLGACLCCVENTKEGHRCVCTDGPVFNIEELRW